MKKMLFAANLMLAGILITGCGSADISIATSTPIIPTSTLPTSTATQTFTATVVPLVTTTAELLPISPAASAYLKEALDIMQNNSLHRYGIDWEKLYASAFKIAEHAQTPADTYDAIWYALNQLGDHHSHFRTPEMVTEVEQMTVNDSPLPRGKLLLDKIGFIEIERYGSARDSEDSKYATMVQQLIRDLDAQDVCGWIIDLRENTGGSIGPMLAGLGPILGEGEIGAFVDADGNKMVWSYQDGQAWVEEYAQTHVNGPAYQLKVASPPVAVLTGMNTASAGESVVVAFRGRPNTRSFGLYTYGVPTANQVFPLSDGAWIALTTAFYADRTGQIYEDRIYPDEVVDVAWELTIIMEEIIPQPAIDWLMSQPACMPQQ